MKLLALALITILAVDDGPPAIAPGYKLTPLSAPWLSPGTDFPAPLPPLIPDGRTVPVPTVPAQPLPVVAKYWITITNEPGIEGYGRIDQDGYAVDIEARRQLLVARYQPVQPPAPQGDRYGFGAIMQRVFGRNLQHDPELDTWAEKNNVACNSGLGGRRPFPIGGLHKIMAPRASQVAGWNYPTAEAMAEGWRTSPSHLHAIMDRSRRRYGIAHGPGPYWTMNLAP